MSSLIKTRPETIRESRFVQFMEYACYTVADLDELELLKLQNEIKEYIAFTRKARFTNLFRSSALGKLNAINSAIITALKKYDG
jgi:hypothetical protein